MIWLVLGGSGLGDLDKASAVCSSLPATCLMELSNLIMHKQNLTTCGGRFSNGLQLNSGINDLIMITFNLHILADDVARKSFTAPGDSEQFFFNLCIAPFSVS